MKKLFAALALLGFLSSACAQQDMVAMKYARIITPALAKKHLDILASDAFEGRETGKPGADRAAHYIADEFKALGLKAVANGSYFFDVPLAENLVSITFYVNGQSYINGHDFYSPRSYADSSLNANEVVFIGFGTDSAITNMDLKGKVLIWINEDKPQAGVKTNTSFRPSNARIKILTALEDKHPAIILATNVDAMQVIKRYSGSSGSHLRIKGVTRQPSALAGVILITSAMADNLLKSGGKSYDELKSAAVSGNMTGQVMKSDVKISFHTDLKDVKAADVLGYLPGSDPKLKDEVLVISAHYDHLGLLPDTTKGDRVFNGADDDGSGTTGILEIARAFSKAKADGHGPRRSILFLGNVGEEKGLLGSEYYTDHPVISLANTIADLNIDMIGRVGADYIGKADSVNNVYVIGSAMLSSGLHKANEHANSTYTRLDLDYKYDDPNDPNRFYYRSDHYNFAKHGVPIIFYFNGVHADYHQLSDEVSKINFPLLAKRAQLVFYTAWDLVNADERPVVDMKK